MDGDRGDEGLEGRFLSADIALFADVEGVEVDGVQRFVGDDDLYLERVAPFLFSVDTSGSLALSSADCLCIAWSSSYTSILTVQNKSH